nr:DNA damage-binding protein 1 [Tanacetum cinerariifolium]GEW73753.1 DNA damage-binding protein 1 [Tanacetum cinerariifolium]
MHPYTTISDPKGVVYLNKDKKRILIKFDETHKFSDGTLNNVCKKFKVMLRDNELGFDNANLDNYEWTKNDIKRTTLEELQVLDIKCLYGYPKPTIVVLYQFLIPVPPPFCGVLIVKEETIVYCSASTSKSIPIRPGRRLSTSSSGDVEVSFSAIEVASTNVSRMSNAQPKRQLNLGKHKEEISQNKKGYRCCDINLKKRPEIDVVVAILEAIDSLKGGGMILSDQEQHGYFSFNRTRGTSIRYQNKDTLVVIILRVILHEADDEAPIEEQHIPTDASPTTLSSSYVIDSDLEEDPEEDPVDYPVNGGDEEEEESYGYDVDDEDKEEAFKDDDEEEEEHLALAESFDVPVVDHVPLAEDIEAFETN